MKFLAQVLILQLSFCGVYAQTSQKAYALYSPDKKLEIKVEKHDGSYWYSFSANKKLLIGKSPIGFETVKNGKIPSAGWIVTAQDRKTVNSVWKPVWGKRQIVSDHYNELTLKLSSADNNSEKMNVVFRAYN